MDQFQAWRVYHSRGFGFLQLGLGAVGSMVGSFLLVLVLKIILQMGCSFLKISYSGGRILTEHIE